MLSAVAETLRSDWLTTGPAVDSFEHAVAERVHATHAVAVSSGTAAVARGHVRDGIGPRGQVIVPPMTFAATANCVMYQGGTPVFADARSQAPCCLIRLKWKPKSRAYQGDSLPLDYAGPAL